MNKKLRTLLALVLTALLAMSLSACGGGGKNDVTGKYILVQQDSYDGVFYETDQEDPNYLLLKKGGKGQYYAGLSFDLKWSLDGQSFIGCYKLLGNEFGMEGTLHDGLLELNEDGLQMRFVKEGTEIPDAWRLSGQDVSGKQTHLAGEYTLIGMMTGSKTLTQAQVEAAGLADNTVLRIRCAQVILATGGPAGIYFNRVYPESQFGMSGMAFEAGAAGANLDCWQYGLASVGFRWNVSGSYQQAIPRYVSVDAQGVEREFLAQAMGEREALQNTFLKGYQWPFDPRKAEGSSRVDILVKAEEDAGRRVYMDYTRNPAGFAPENLSTEAREYLENCGALRATPLERLRAINAPAIALYRDHGIDLATEYLEISVCAQHHNGGVQVDCHWQTCVPGLYACGELLDIDGDCGGYNLQWAWSSGFIAGKSAAVSLLSHSQPPAETNF